MEDNYRYFNRDISWLSFNHRVLQEAADKRLPLYERIKFVGIYSSNIEEFYRVRVAAIKSVLAGGQNEELSVDEARTLLASMNTLIQMQFVERKALLEGLIDELKTHHIRFYQSADEVPPVYHSYLATFFEEEVFPYLQPVRLDGDVRYFMRDQRIYMVVDTRSRRHGEAVVFLLKIPYSQVERFIGLPVCGGEYGLMYIEDLIQLHLPRLLPGYVIEGSYVCKLSRDADVFVDELLQARKISQIKEKVKKRKIGAVARFVHDSRMPVSTLHRMLDYFGIREDACMPTLQHLNLDDLTQLPNPTDETLRLIPLPPVTVSGSNRPRYMFRKIASRDRLFWYPYQSFDHFIQFLYEAVHDPLCTDIMLTQYRVADHSEVINTLIAAAQNGKRVTVFVELKARFDEENNLETAEMMRKAGIHILFSIPGLKVHAKVALVLRKDKKENSLKSFACISTGNFNELTARTYADVALFTANRKIVNDVHTLFNFLQRREGEPRFEQLLISKFNLLDTLHQLIDMEIALAKSGKPAEIILKMNALQDIGMINRLYEASMAGVKITLIVRGICCLVPDEPFSKHIRVLRIVDRFLEHARIWYFYQGGEELLFLGSPDWMRRNLHKRIEAVTPVFDKKCKVELLDFLKKQINVTDKTTQLNRHLDNCRLGEGGMSAQTAFYAYLQQKLK